MRLTILFTSSSAEALVAEEFSRYQASSLSPNDVKAFLLVSEARNCFMGSNSIYDTTIKVLSRILPLYQAPLRVRQAFMTRHRHMHRGLRSQSKLYQGRQITASREAGMPNASSGAMTTSATSPAGGQQQQRQATRGRSARNAAKAVGRTTSRAKSRAAQAVQRSMYRLESKGFVAVPFLSTAIFSGAVLAFCVTVYVRLATWGAACSDHDIKNFCVIRSFPIFSRWTAEDRACSCNTMLFTDISCAPANLTSNGHGHQQEPKDATATTKSKNYTNGTRFASEVLNSSTTMNSVAIAMIRACPEDTELTNTLSHHLRDVVVLYIIGHHTLDEHLESAHLLETDMQWELPDDFGKLRNTPSSWWQLQLLAVSRLRLRAWPRNLQRFPDLQHLEFSHTLIADPVFPADVVELSVLKTLRLGGNHLSVLPVDLSRMEHLVNLALEANNFSSIDGQTFDLSQLHALVVDDNKLAAIPEGFGRLTALERLYLANNRLNQTLPSSLAGLTNLHLVDLHVNQLSEFPKPFIGMNQPMYLNLELNAISRSTIDAFQQSALSSRQTKTSDSLALVGYNPVCFNASTMPSAASSGLEAAIPTRIGSWQLKCEPECALGCLDTKLGDLDSFMVESIGWRGDGFCTPACSSASCGFDGGDCDPTMKVPSGWLAARLKHSRQT